MAQGRTCLEKLLAGEIADASELMHENLQKLLPPEKLASGMKALRAKIGDVDSVTVTSESFAAGEPPQLRIRYHVTAADGDVDAEVVYDFTPWQGQLLGIQVPAE